MKPEDQERLKQAQDLLGKINEVAKNSSQYFGDFIVPLHKEKRTLLIYVGSIAGGAAALSPQLLNGGVVYNKTPFFLGVFILILVLVLSVAYVLSTVEKDIEGLNKVFIKTSKCLQEERGIWINFIVGGDYSNLVFENTYRKYSNLFDQHQVDLQKEQSLKKSSWLVRQEYIGEFQIWLFINGAGLLFASLLPLSFKPTFLLIVSTVLLVATCFIFEISEKMFVWLGLPIDLIKYVFGKRSKRQ